MKNPFISIFKAKRPCPHCGTVLRFPTNKGTLRITCPRCRQSFVMEIRRPKPFVWHRGRTVAENFSANIDHWKDLWRRSPVTVLLFIALLVMTIVLIVRFVLGLGGPHHAPVPKVI